MTPDEEFRLMEMERRLTALEGKVNPLDEAGLDRLRESGLLQFDGIPMRWDSGGMQIKSGTAATVIPLLRIVKNLFAARDNSGNPPVNTPGWYLGGYVGSSSDVFFESFVAADISQDGSAGDFSGVQSWIDSNSAEYWQLVRNGAEAVSTQLTSDDAAGNAFALINAALILDIRNADPAIVSDGMLWYRSDTDRARLRANATTVDLATTTDVTDHTGDTSDAHDASAISVDSTTLVGTGTDVQAVLEELDNGIADHLADTADAHDASAVSVADAGGLLTATDVEAALAEIIGMIPAGGGGMPMPPLVGTDSWYCLGTQLAARSAGAPASATFPASNRALLHPILVTEDCTVVKLWAHNGAAVSGNIDMGIYDSSFAKVVSIGSTAQAGVSEVQEFNIADTALTAGMYYIAVAMDNTTGTLLRWSLDSRVLETYGATYMNTAFALPSTITPAAAGGTHAYLPLIGISTRTLVT